MRLLFVKARLGWPRTYGHDVHCYEMMRALAALGHDVALATDTPPATDALRGLTLSAHWVLEPNSRDAPVTLSYWQERYRRYWGIAEGRIATLRRLSTEWKADAVVVVGLEILPYLGAPAGPVRVWYAADEWVWHYVSQLRSDPRGAIAHLKAAAIKGLYERVYGPIMDRVWVVSEAERRAMALVAGVRHVDVLPNGVDTEAFAPRAVEPRALSAVFWGRLGFGPNLQALRWFLAKVWPLVRQKAPGATFTILGADPPAELTAHEGRLGVAVFANLIDLRPEISRSAVVVLPFVSGGGIKNKLLEAAAMGRPIVATTRATRGLRSRPPLVLADGPDAFAAAMLSLWEEPDRGRTLGTEARTWVQTHHTWTATAREAIRTLQSP